MKQNKIRTYLLYAVGEIALVMIGILLALQINNWNEERINDSERVSLTLTMIDELQEDITLADKNIDILLALKNQNSNLIQRMQGDEASFDTLKKIAFYEFNPVLNGISKYNIVTFSTLQSTGKIEFFSKSLKSSIINYYSTLGSDLIDGNIKIYFDMVSEYNKKYPLLVPNETDQSYLYKIYTTVTDEREFISLMSPMVLYKNFMLLGFIDEYEGTRAESLSLIEELKASI